MSEDEAELLSKGEVSDLVRFLAGMVAIALLFMSLTLLAAGGILTTLSGDLRNAESVCISLGVASMLGAFIAAATREDPHVQTYVRTDDP